VTVLHLRPGARHAADPPAPRAWLRGAALAAAATVGALVGFGLTDGASLARLAAVTLRLRGLPEFVTPDRGAVGAALLGGTHAALLAGLWGAALAVFARLLARRGLRAWQVGAALAAAALAAAAADTLLPTPLRFAAGVLAPAERAVAALLVAAAAWGGARLDDGPTP
jgi:hypothetical protein